MIKFTNPDNLVWRSYAARIILVLITTAIIIAVLPRTQGKMYHYDEGKPWLYEQLIAKFDFPIFKSEETLKSERDSLEYRKGENSAIPQRLQGRHTGFTT